MTRVFCRRDLNESFLGMNHMFLVWVEWMGAGVVWREVRCGVGGVVVMGWNGVGVGRASVVVVVVLVVGRRVLVMMRRAVVVLVGLV